MAKPSGSHLVWLNTHPSLASRVWADWPSALPLRPSVSFFTTGTPVPSICTYKIGTGWPTTMGEIQLNGALDLPMVALRNVAADGLGGALHCLGGHLQTGQDLHLVAAMLEGPFLTDESLHAADSWGELCTLDIQFDIGRELADVTVRAQIVGPRHVH